MGIIEPGIRFLFLDVGKRANPKGVEVAQSFVGTNSQLVLTKGGLLRNGKGRLDHGGFFLDDLRYLDSLGVKEKLGGLIEPLSPNDDFLNGISHPAPGKHG